MILKPGREDDGAARSSRNGTWTPPSSAALTDTGRLVLQHGRRGRLRPAARRRWSTRRRSTTGPGSSRQAAPRSQPADVPAPADCAAALLNADRLPRPRLQALDLGAVRPSRDGRHACSGRRRRRRRSCACTARKQGAGADLRLHAALLSPPIPYEGGKQAVAEAWRNLTAVGADPHRHHRQPQLRQSRAARDHGPVRRLPSRAWPRPAGRSTSRSCRGNVTLYNETNGAAIPPTPTIGGGRPDRRTTPQSRRLRLQGSRARRSCWSARRQRRARRQPLSARDRWAARTARRRRSIWRPSAATATSCAA